MAGLVIALAFALLAACAILLARRRTSGWEALGAALLVGVAGYAWQGHPSLAGHPADAATKGERTFDERLIERRRALGAGKFGEASRWFTLSDGLARQGDSRSAANVLASAVRSSPGDADLWLGLGNALVAHEVGLGNALVAHEEGQLSPAAEYAYRRALAIDRTSLAARYFYALALAQSGQMAPARAMWSGLAAEMPEGTPFRMELERNVALIDRMTAAQAGARPDIGR